MVPNSPDEDQSRERFEELLSSSQEHAADMLQAAHPADGATWLLDIDEDDAWRVFSMLDADCQARILEYAEDELTSHLVGRMSTPDLREVVEEMPTDEAADLLGEADDRVTQDVLAALDDKTAEELRQLISYDPDSAGGVMATEVITVSPEMRVGDVVKQIKKQSEEVEGDLGTFVVDEENRPVGYLSDRDLLTNNIHELVEDVMVDPFVIEVHNDQEDAARLIERYGLQALAVTNANGALVGVISAEDASEIREVEADEDIARMAGTSTGQQTRLPILRRVRQRMPLMMLTVIGGVVSAKILAYFTGGSPNAGAAGEGIAQTSDILRYLPLIIGLAGNVGVQSSTILIRGLATGEIEKSREWRVLGGEIGVGVTIGLLCGIVVMVASSLLELGSPMSTFGFSVGAATTLAVGWAALLGCVTPMGCRSLGVDPAIVAGPFLISFSDVTGSVIYILIASALLL